MAVEGGVTAGGEIGAITFEVRSDKGGGVGDSVCPTVLTAADLETSSTFKSVPVVSELTANLSFAWAILEAIKAAKRVILS